MGAEMPLPSLAYRKGDPGPRTIFEILHRSTVLALFLKKNNVIYSMEGLMGKVSLSLNPNAR